MPSASVASAWPIRHAQTLALLAIAALVLLAYRNSLTIPYLLDDQSSIEFNPTLRNLGRSLQPEPDSPLGGRPLANLSFALNHAWGGLDVTGYHVVNLAIHLGTALALFGTLRRTLAATAPSVTAVGLAAAAAALWAVHPANTAAVSYLSQRTESLMGLFFVLTFYTLVRGVETGRNGWLAASVATTFAGMAVKEVMVTAPVLVLLYDRTFLAGSFRGALRSRGRYYALLASAWLLLAWLLADLGRRKVGFDLGVSPWHYALTESRAIFTYLRTAFWPYPLIFDHGPDFLRTFGAAAPCAILLALGLAATAAALWLRPRAAFPAAWFLITLAPTSSFVPVALQPVAENRLYLPLMGAVTALVLGVDRLLGRPGRWLLAATAAAFALLTAGRNAVMQSPLSLWADTVAKRPANPRAHDNLALALLQAGRPEEAVASYQRALALNPASSATHAMLGDVWLKLGRLDEAGARFAEAVRLDPRSANGYNNLGGISARLGRMEEAVARYRRAVEIDPRFAIAHHNLANALYQLQRYEEAAAAYRAAVAVNPADRIALSYLGLTLTQLGRSAEAEAVFREALRVAPDFAEARNNYGVFLLHAGRLPEALRQFEEAVRCDPANGAARSNRDAVRALLAGGAAPPSAPPPAPR